MFTTIETINVPAIAQIDTANGGQVKTATADRLTDIAHGIQEGFEILAKAQSNMALLAAEIGKAFLEAKAIIKTRGRGKTANKAIPTWAAYCKEHGFSDTQADKYIRCHEFRTVFPMVAEHIPSLEDMSNFQKALKHDAKKADGIFAKLETDLEDGTEVNIPWNPACAGEWLVDNLQTTKANKTAAKAKAYDRLKAKTTKKSKGFEWPVAPTKDDCQQAVILLNDPAGGNLAVFVHKLVVALECNGIEIPNWEAANVAVTKSKKNKDK
tara:strand:- start:1208 stop:2011 length:804 start_codon:yes stop_codon:yes gene_type:complete